jgi:Fe2+ transport system protein B
MKAAADYTIKATREKFGQELDFSKESIIKLESFLEQAYQSLSSRVKDDKAKASIFRTANAWGSYLGEFMRLKWGGTWIMKDSERILSIKSIDFHPIGFVYQKITNHPEYSVSQYLSEVERKISPQPINSSQSQTIPENVSQPKTQTPVNQSQNTVKIDKKLIFAVVGVGGFVFILVACVVGFVFFNAGGVEFKSSLNAFLAEAEKLNLMTEQGVNFEEYRTQLIEVKSTYALIDSWPMSYQNEKRSFDLAIKGWDYALDVWNDQLIKLSGDFSNYKKPDWDGVGIYLGNPDVGGGYKTVELLMLQASIYYEAGKAGVK